MRRFLIWSAVAALVGLMLAGAGVWAYWAFFGRYQPVTVTRDQAEIQRLLDESSWVSAGHAGAPVYVIGYRDSAAFQRWSKEQAPKLEAAGADLRYLVFARRDREGLRQSTAAERATVAELWLTRNWTLYQRWTATPTRNWTAAGMPSADGDLARGAVVEATRDFVDELTGRLRGSGLKPDYPLILWRDREGFLKACACVEARSWSVIGDDLGAAVQAEAAPVETLQEEPGVVVPSGPQPLPYPDLGSPETGPASPAIEAAPEPTRSPNLIERILPPAPGPASPPQSDRPATRPTPARPAATPPARQSPARPPANRRPPEAQRQEDSTFF